MLSCPGLRCIFDFGYKICAGTQSRNRVVYSSYSVFNFSQRSCAAMDKDGNEFSSEWLEGSDGGALEDT